MSNALARPAHGASRLGLSGGVSLALVAASVATAGSAQAQDHVVQPGETVSHLALRYGASSSAIVEANHLNSAALIRVGQKLQIPAGTSTTTASTASATTTTRSHNVRPGDSVWLLARQYGTTVDAIVSANGLDSRALIRIGQRLQIPGTASGSTTNQSATQSSGSTSTARTHTVRSGDSVWLLARQYGTTVNAIISANGLDSRALIRTGQRLQIPSTATTSSTTVGNTFAGRTYPAATVSSANQNKATLLAMGVPSRAEMQALVAATARDMGVDPALAMAIAYQESGFDHSQVSPANAIGTMQVIPSSGEWASDLVGRDLNLLDPHDNVVAGVALLRQLIRSSGDRSTAIAGYYQGLSSVRRYGMFSDTERYVANILALTRRFA